MTELINRIANALPAKQPTEDQINAILTKVLLDLLLSGELHLWFSIENGTASSVIYVNISRHTCTCLWSPMVANCHRYLLLVHYIH